MVGRGGGVRGVWGGCGGGVWRGCVGGLVGVWGV